MNKKVIVMSSAILGTLLLVGASCTGANTTNKNTTNVPVVEIIPTIEIVSPIEGATVASKLPLEIKTTDFTLAPKELEKANVTLHGHYHVWIDGTYFANGTATSMTVVDKNGNGLTSGGHTIQVSLQNNDHTDLTTPAKSAIINVTVK